MAFTEKDLEALEKRYLEEEAEDSQLPPDDPSKRTLTTPPGWASGGVQARTQD